MVKVRSVIDIAHIVSTNGGVISILRGEPGKLPKPMHITLEVLDKKNNSLVLTLYNFYNIKGTLKISADRFEGSHEDVKRTFLNFEKIKDSTFYAKSFDARQHEIDYLSKVIKDSANENIKVGLEERRETGLFSSYIGLREKSPSIFEWFKNKILYPTERPCNWEDYEKSSTYELVNKMGYEFRDFNQMDTIVKIEGTNASKQCRIM